MVNNDNIGGKLIIKGIIKCETGLHIGSSEDVSSIGGVDNLVVRDPFAEEPYIPGSSLKGKLRSLLEKYKFITDIAQKDKESKKSHEEPQDIISDFFNVNIGTGANRIYHHECDEPECAICSLFGASNSTDNKKISRPARLIVRDCVLEDNSRDKLKAMESVGYMTEVKFENALDRMTSNANPRQVERVPRCAEFSFELIYSAIHNIKDFDVLSITASDDIASLFIAMRLLQDDYLGGNGSRGYGKIKFTKLIAEWRHLGYYASNNKNAKAKWAISSKEHKDDNSAELVEFAEEVYSKFKEETDNLNQ